MSERLRVLVVEDNPADVELVREYMSDSGFMSFQIDSASRLSEAISRLGGKSFDLLLIDLGLPDSRGLETFDRLRKAAPGTPAIILTGHDDEEAAITAVRNGAQDYLIKGEIIGNILVRAAQYAVERKRAEKELGESEARYRVLFEETKQGILVADAQTQRFTYANRSMARILGYSHEELLRLGVADIHPQESLPHVLSEFEAQLRHEKMLSAGLPCLRKDGTIFYADINSSPIFFDGRQCNAAFFTDITERKWAEEAQRQAEENFRRSMDESPMGIRIVSATGETLYANRAILDIYGFKDTEELRSTPVKNRYTPDSYAEFQIRRKNRMNGEDCPPKYEISIIRKTGEIRRLEVYRKEIIWNGQKQYEAIYQDITERKKSEEKLRETLGSLRTAFRGIIQVLSVTSEKRDPYTAGHQNRVADLARAIGQEMGLAAERAEGLRLAGTIHDIGKISVPAEILSKPARLTEVEYNLIQSHSQVGYDIIKDVDFSWPIAKMILQHHERMNGSGYPNRLKGDEILLESRILAVSDVVEAMATHRPYRPALGIDVALGEIEKNKGVLYDTQVVSACLTLFRDKGFKFK